MISRRMIFAVAGSLLLGTGAAAAETVKVGIIGPFSGPFALQGKNFKAGIDAYQALNGESVGGNEIEIIYRDLPTPNPQQARAIAQELVVKDKVQYLGGVYFTPDALAITPLLTQANTPLVIFNAATSAIVEQSPLVVRTSFTLWQTATPLGKAAIDRGSRRKRSRSSAITALASMRRMPSRKPSARLAALLSSRSACRCRPMISARSCSV